MTVRTSLRSVIVFGLILVAVSLPARRQAAGASQASESLKKATERGKPAWLAGTGDSLRIKVSGDVVDADGNPLRDYRLQVEAKSNYHRQKLSVMTEGHRFEFWVPVGRLDWFNVQLNATSADRRLIAAQMLPNFELRQAAVDGLTLEMKPAERTVQIAVVDDGKPVPHAFVAAEFVGARVTGKTNDEGVFAFPAAKGDSLSQLTAWTEGFEVGGFSFNRDPPRDPLGDSHTIEIEKCRDETVRLVNAADNSPVPDVEFQLVVGTGPPNYQFTGRIPACEMKSDANGEAVYRWFPDWEQNGSYAEILDPRWVKEKREERTKGTIIVKLKKSQFENRKRVVGKVDSVRGNVAGLLVNVQSFQGEQENRSDQLAAFTDQDGRFAVDVLPGATYCICVNDARYVSSIIDSLLYDPENEEVSEPSLEVRMGKPVQVVATSGPDKRPIAHQGIQLETLHRYSWLENGRRQNGRSGRRWWVTTDEEGKAFTFAQPGTEIVGSLYSPEWRASETAEISDVGVTRLEFHRQITESRRIVGQLRLAENVEADLNGATIEVGSLDGESRERLTLEADANGAFEFDSKATRLGIYTRTKDTQAAAVAVVDRLNEPIEVELYSTAKIQGQLLGGEDWPVANHNLQITLYVTGPRQEDSPGPTSFLAARFESTTDDAGNYTFEALPRNVQLTMFADPIDDSGRSAYLQRVYLSPDDGNPWFISRFRRRNVAVAFPKRFQNTLRDCELLGFHAMLIAYRPSDSTKRFVDRNLMDYGKTKEVSSYMQLFARSDSRQSLQLSEFLDSKSWKMPDQGRVFACAIDGSGQELGRIEFDCEDRKSAELAQKFIREHAPEPVDARAKWKAAFETARATDRNVWVRISQRYCGPCFLMARWLDDHKTALEQDYVVLKVDDVRDLHGREIAQRLTKGEHHGVPFHAIFDPNGGMLIDSVSPIGNVGHPSGFEGKKHLRKMLAQTSKRLTEAQREEIVGSLGD